VSSVLVLFRAAVSAIVSFAVLLTVYFVQLLSSFLCKFEQNKDWLIEYYNDNVLWDVSNASFINLELKDAAW